MSVGPEPARAPLSVAIVAKDAGRDIGRCVRSVAWAEEVVVVVDPETRDRTAAIAAELGARVLREPWRGYAATKNLAADLVSHEWILSLDADEWLTPAGAAEIREVLRGPRHDVYAVPRRPVFCGAFVDRAWAPDVHARLYRKGRARFAGGRVHESLRPHPGATVGRLREPLPHLTYRSIGDYVARMNRYTDLAAADLVDAGRRPSAWRSLASAAAAFGRAYLLKRGFLDGYRGLVVACGGAAYAFLKYAKLWDRSRAGSDELRRVAGATPEDPDPAAPAGDQPG